MNKKTEFLLDVTLVSPDFKDNQILKLIVKFGYTQNDYGNGTYMLVKSRDNGSFEQCYDIRYDKEFNSNMPESYIVNWVYNHWTGKNGSWHVIRCSIALHGGERQLRKEVK